MTSLGPRQGTDPRAALGHLPNWPIGRPHTRRKRGTVHSANRVQISLKSLSALKRCQRAASTSSGYACRRDSLPCGRGAGIGCALTEAETGIGVSGDRVLRCVSRAWRREPGKPGRWMMPSHRCVRTRTERVLINGKEDSDPPYQGNFGLGNARQAANCLKTGRVADPGASAPARADLPVPRQPFVIACHMRCATSA